MDNKSIIGPRHRHQTVYQDGHGEQDFRIPLFDRMPSKRGIQPNDQALWLRRRDGWLKQGS